MKASIIMRTVTVGLLVFSILSSSLSPAQAQSRGLVISAPCPHSCRTMGLNKKMCRDWREGNTCYVEDLTRKPLPQSQPQQPQPVQPPPSYQQPPPPAQIQPPMAGGNGNNECKQMANYYLARPRVDVGKTKPTGNFFGDKIKAYGSVEGICLVEAGVFENGRKVQSIPLVTTSEFRRFEFEVTSKSSKDPEIRVYNIRGDSDIVSLNEIE